MGNILLLIQICYARQNSVADIVTRLWTGKPRNRSSIAGTKQFSPKCPDRPWGQPSIYKIGIAGAVKVKVKFTLEQATKAHRGSRGIALLFL